MGKMGHGYGSEFHLLRFLGYHRNRLNQTIEKECGGRVIDWLDFGFCKETDLGHADSEWKGMDFLDPNSGVKSAWMNYWPQSGNVPNWDAVGVLDLNSNPEFLLIEAKAHVEEIESSCGARENGGFSMIERALSATISANEFNRQSDNWLRPYYQYANRVAQLDFLLEHGVMARLIFVYFCGDKWPRDGRRTNCPQNESEWDLNLRPMYKHLGLSGQSSLESRIHSLFLDVRGNS